jgi:hypothetical protein
LKQLESTLKCESTPSVGTKFWFELELPVAHPDLH